MRVPTVDMRPVQPEAIESVDVRRREGRPQGGEEAAAAADGEAAAQVEEPLEEGTEQPEPDVAAEYPFAGQTFKDQAHAERVFRDNAKNLKATQQQLEKQKSEALKLRGVAAEALRTVRMWEEAGYGPPASQGPSNGQPAGGRQVQGQVVAGGQPAAGGGAPETPWFERDGFLDQARDLYAEHGFDVAMLHILTRLNSVVEERISQALDGRVGPLEQQSKAVTVYNTAMGDFYGVADEVDAAQKPLFPELSPGSEPSVHTEIANLWREIDPELKLGRRGVRMAVMEWRAGYRAGGQQVEPRSVAPLDEPAGAPSVSGVSRALADREAASSVVLDGRGTPRPARAGEDTPEARRRAALRQGIPTVKMGSVDLGFTA